MISARLEVDPFMRIDERRFVHEVGEMMLNEIVPNVKLLMGLVVEDWKSKPKFSVRYEESLGTRVGRGNWKVHVYPDGPVAKVWGWLTHGVPGREIVPRNADFLKYRTEYKAKTSPSSPYYSGPGVYRGPTVYASSAPWPGIEPRNFEEQIEDDYREPFFRHFERGVNRILIFSR